jgi:hypothetical protein
MTVIAWDGKTLAADKRSTFGGTPLTTTKIVRVFDKLVGAAGESGKCRAAVQWLRNGGKPEDYKGFDGAQLLVIDAAGVPWMYDESPQPIRLDDKCVAIGGGMSEAMVAMACGKNAREAVELACRFNTGCGNGIDVLELEASSQPGALAKGLQQ